MNPRSSPMRFFITAGEASGDQLGAALMRDLKAREPDSRFLGIGGPLMLAEGLEPIFPMTEISVMGFFPVIKKLPGLLARIRQTARAIVRERPDVAVLIDAQDFSRRVARQARQLAPEIPILGYVAPSVWAWRPNRARVLKPLLDHLLAILPFEPDVMRRLGGPPTSYVGHPLASKLAMLRRTLKEEAAPPLVLMLPGSRRSEIARLLPVFGETASALSTALAGKVRFVLPAVEHLLPQIREAVRTWAVQPEIVSGEDAKWRAFLAADAALAASGTVTLELGLADVPMVVAYQVSAIEAAIVRRLISIDTTVLPDIILDQKQIPFFIQKECNSKTLLAALLPLLSDGSERRVQLQSFARLREVMAHGTDRKGRVDAADLVLQFARKRLASPRNGDPIKLL